MVDDKFTTWNANVRDEFKGKAIEEIRETLKQRSLPMAVLATNIIGDFNVSSCIRAANGFGVTPFYYYGKRKYDKRGAQGTYHYTDVIYLEDVDSVLKLKDKYELVALENNIPNKCVDNIYTFEWKDNTLLVVGEEGIGISPEILEICDKFVEIPMDRGSVRSFNLSAAASMAMFDFSSKHFKIKLNDSIHSN